MSLILEALRKSEADRRRGETPNVHVELSPSPMPRRSHLPAWAWWTIAAVMGAAGWWFLHARTSQLSPETVIPAASTPAAFHDETEMDPLPPVKHLSLQPMRAATPAPVAMASRITAVSSVRQDSIPVIATPAPIPILASSPAERDLLRLSDLSIQERKGLPPLKLTMHMWNDDPAQRFVILDGNRLHEGDRVGDATITTIMTDGVLLDWNGRRLKLPIR